VRCRSLIGPILLLLAATAAAQRLPEPVYPLRDDVGLLDASAAERVREEIARLEAATSAEIAVLVVATTAGENHHEYAQRVFNHWGVGKAEANNGVLLLFAMNDRRVELVPGIAYERLFHRRRSEELLEGVVVPHMRAGRPERAVLAIVEEVAREIRIHEGVEAPAPAGVAEAGEGRATNDPAAADRQSASPPPRSPTRATTLTPQQLAEMEAQARARERSRRLVLVLGVLLFIAWAVVSVVLLVAAFSGKSLVPRRVMWVIVLGGGAVVAAVSIYIAFVFASGGLGGVGGAVALMALVFGGLSRHSCPRCRKWMTIHSRTITPATYSSSGSGLRTRSCRHCQFHDEQNYTIPRKRRVTSSSSSGGFSSRGGGSFGGGRSRGGGGGASW
jgi:uncharacterized protein